MKNMSILPHALFLVAALSFGCAALPLFSFMGSAYSGYVFWDSGVAKKYYAFDIDTTYLAVVRASNQLKLEATLIKSTPKSGYSLETKGNIPMHIDILPIEKDVTTVVISIQTFGDKQYVELFFNFVDDNLQGKSTVGKEK